MEKILGDSGFDSIGEFLQILFEEDKENSSDEEDSVEDIDCGTLSDPDRNEDVYNSE